MNRLLGSLAAAVLLCAIAAPPANANTIYSDLTGTVTPGGYIVGQYSPGSSYVLGTAFTPTGNNYQLDQIQALLSFGSGTNDMIVGLYTNSGGVPGSLLESWNLVNVLGTSPGIVTMNSVLSPTLSAGQQYWITAGMSQSTSVGVWWINSLGLQGIATYSLNGGPFLLGNSTSSGFHAFAVTGTPIANTPEPGSILLLGIGLLCVVGAARRKLLG